MRSLALLDSSPAFGLDGTDPEAWKRLAPRSRSTPGETPASIAEPVLRSIMAPDADERAVAAAVASMSRISAAGLRAADRVPARRTTCARASARSPCRRSCSSASATRRRRSSYAEALAAGIPGARLQIIPGAGHIANLEAPEAVNAALREHLDAVEAAAMTEWRWLDVFARHLRACALSHGEVVAVLSESASRAGARRDQPASPRRCWAAASTTSSCRRRANAGPVALRSTGASRRAGRQPAARSRRSRPPTS